VNPKFLKYCEWIVAILLSTVVLFFLFVRATHAGALWRDEAATLQLAQMPTVGDIAANFQHEAFPIPFPLLIRAYVGIFGASDASLRWFGFAIGAGLLAAAWFNSRALDDRGPFLLLSLFSLNATFLLWGTSLRGYGIGCVLLLVAIGLTAKAICHPTRSNAIAATVAAIGSTQFMINAVPLIAGIAASAIIVFVVQREFRKAGIVCLCVTLCALLFVPYLPSYFSADWNIVLKFPTDLASLWPKLHSAITEGGSGFFWCLAPPVIVVAAIWRLWRLRGEKSSVDYRLLLFLTCVTIFSICAYYAFLKILSYATRPWYYLPLLCVVASAIDLAAGIMSRLKSFRAARLAFTIAATVLLPARLWNIAHERLTNIEIVARKLEQEAAPNDLIVVNPWYYGPSFYRYYYGTAHWLTVPTMSEHRLHRYDLMKSKMVETNPLNDVRSSIQQTLQSGHRVWIVGGARPPEPGLPLSIQPAPDPEFGWIGQAYVNVWSMQLADFLQKHVVEGTIALPPDENVNSDENIALLAGRVWRE
jgi:hypothetical protein